MVGSSQYRVTMPVLTSEPLDVICHVKGTLRGCTMLVTEDYQALVIELKSACLALGGTPNECQTVDVNNAAR